jgi:hypothetical protein
MFAQNTEKKYPKRKKWLSLRIRRTFKKDKIELAKDEKHYLQRERIFLPIKNTLQRVRKSLLILLRR